MAPGSPRPSTTAVNALEHAVRALGDLSNLSQSMPHIELDGLRNPHLQRTARKSRPVKGTTQILKTSISIAQELECALVDLRRDMQTRLNTIQTALAPISTLPPEVLCHIFLLMLSEPGTIDPNASASVFSISKVSRTWRAVAVSQSALWTQIHVEWSIPFQNLWLCRSRHHLLHIVAICLCASRREASRVALSRQLWDSSNRWVSLSVYNLGHGDLQLFVVPALCGERGLANLQSVTLVAGSDANLFGLGVYVTVHPYRLPNVQRLHLSGVRMPALVSIASDITSLELSDFTQTLDELGSLLRTCAKLEILTLTRIGMPAADADRLLLTERSRILLPCLRELYYTAQRALSCTHTFMFHCFLAPKLRSLSLNMSTPIDAPGTQSYHGIALFVGQYTWVVHTQISHSKIYTSIDSGFSPS